jgi:hypothetical protein
MAEPVDPATQPHQASPPARMRAQNDSALAAVYGAELAQVTKIKAEQPHTTWINIFGNNPTENGYDKFAMLPQVTAVLVLQQSKHDLSARSTS